MDIAPDLLDLLPGELRAIAEQIGIPLALRLVEYRGGRRIFIPAYVTDEHPLATLLGLDAAEALCRKYSGERLEIPRALEWFNAMRNLVILKSRDAGVSQATLAGEHRLTERHIRNIERRFERDDRQLGLFSS